MKIRHTQIDMASAATFARSYQVLDMVMAPSENIVLGIIPVAR